MLVKSIATTQRRLEDPRSHCRGFLKYAMPLSRMTIIPARKFERTSLSPDGGISDKLHPPPALKATSKSSRSLHETKWGISSSRMCSGRRTPYAPTCSRLHAAPGRMRYHDTNGLVAYNLSTPSTPLTSHFHETTALYKSRSQAYAKPYGSQQGRNLQTKIKFCIWTIGKVGERGFKSTTEDEWRKALMINMEVNTRRNGHKHLATTLTYRCLSHWNATAPCLRAWKIFTSLVMSKLMAATWHLARAPGRPSMTKFEKYKKPEEWIWFKNGNLHWFLSRWKWIV